MYNKIWEDRNTWKYATITPLIKAEKDPKGVRSYRPLSLTNILCKMFKMMTNERLVWYQKNEKKNGRKKI